MKTIISLAVTTLLMFGSCKKGELENIKPLNPTTSERKPEAKLAPTADKENVAGELSNGDPNPY
ncbi:MAG: hypothetical protein JWO44_2317 [Bacteroidetes bacterium]|nr:hypothetical protein [Bacteroidota bacterium]